MSLSRSLSVNLSSWEDRTARSEKCSWLMSEKATDSLTRCLVPGRTQCRGPVFSPERIKFKGPLLCKIPFNSQSINNPLTSDRSLRDRLALDPHFKKVSQPLLPLCDVTKSTGRPHSKTVFSVLSSETSESLSPSHSRSTALRLTFLLKHHGRL